MKIFYCYLIVFILLTASCSSEKQDITQSTSSQGKETVAQDTKTVRGKTVEQGSYDLKIIPETAFRNSVFQAFSKNINLSDARVQWLKNKELFVGAEGERVASLELNKGDTVQAMALANNIQVFSNEVKIRNSPPEITSVNIEPETYNPEEPFAVDVEWRDIDNDDVLIAYEWSKNDEPLQTGEKIEGDFKRGDKLNIKITSFDGEEYGEPIYLNRQIQNMPPEIIYKDKEFSFDGRLYTYQVMASDPDDDELTYSITSDIEDIRIDSRTGMITWNVPDDFLGDVAITVSVKDGNGGESTQGLTISINKEEQPVQNEGENQLTGGN